MIDPRVLVLQSGKRQRVYYLVAATRNPTTIKHSPDKRIQVISEESSKNIHDSLLDSLVDLRRVRKLLW